MRRGAATTCATAGDSDDYASLQWVHTVVDRNQATETNGQATRELRASVATVVTNFDLQSLRRMLDEDHEVLFVDMVHGPY